MGSGYSFPKDKKIVVIGGGYGGAFLCVDLKKAGANYLLIDEKSFFYHNVASVRAVVDTAYTNKLYIPYENTFGDCFKQGRVNEIKPNDKQVILEGGEAVTYDVLVLATGSRYTAPFKCDPTAAADEKNNTHLLNSYAERIKSAAQIVIVGGGPVACEVAGEITHYYKDKDVTLIHQTDELVYKGAKFQSALQSKLTKRGVKLVLGSKVSNIDEVKASSGSCVVRTEDGQEFPADVAFCCVGNTSIQLDYAAKLGPDCFDKHGFLKVNDNFQVEGHTHIFAMGDCCNADVMKLAFAVKCHRDVLFKNIIALFSGSSMKKYKPESGPYYSIGVSLGPNDAVGTFYGYGAPTFLLVSLKSKDLMYHQFWKDMQQTPPK